MNQLSKLPDQLAHVHAADHLLEDLVAGVDAQLVHVPVPLGPHKVQLAAAAEAAPLRVDHHVLLAGEVQGVDGADGRDLLEVAGVGARAQYYDFSG